MAEKRLEQSGLRAWQLAMVLLVASFLIISRRPDAIFNAQFWGEDGTVFFADAYNLGWFPALLRQFAGYFEVFPRIGAAVALLVPLATAPLLLNLIAIVSQALPVNLLLSSRSSAWGSLRFRALLAGVYLATPNAWELTGSITNSQWFLAMSAFLLLVASKPRSGLAQSFDLCVLAICGLSGPFCVFLFPISVVVSWKERDRWRWIASGTLALTCLIQGWGLVNGGLTARPHAPFGASPEMLVRVIAGQLYIGAFLGTNPLAAHPGITALVVFSGIAVAGTVLVTICLRRAPLRMNLFFSLSILILTASLIAPRLGESSGRTVLMHMALGGGERYWFFPSLAIEWLLLWQYQSSKVRLSRITSAALLCVLCFGVVLKWKIPAFHDMHFAEYAKRFEVVPAGTVMVIPENPPGWEVQLVKHASRR